MSCSEEEVHHFSLKEHLYLLANFVLNKHCETLVWAAIQEYPKICSLGKIPVFVQQFLDQYSLSQE